MCDALLHKVHAPLSVPSFFYLRDLRGIKLTLSLVCFVALSLSAFAFCCFLQSSLFSLFVSVAPDV